jgi:predicted secreted protein
MLIHLVLSRPSLRSARAVRAGLLSVLALAAAAGVARAGDGAAADVLGFSPDGRYFAFQQHGEEDGSGAIYYETTAVDVANDRPVAGTPFVAASPEEATKHAEALLRRLDIGNAGIEVVGVPASRAHEVISPRDVNPVMDAAVAELSLGPAIVGAGGRILLRAADLDAPRCRGLVPEGRPQGFTLVLERPDMAPLVLHRDRELPQSRGCPDRYGLAGAYALATPAGDTALAVLLQYFYFAFEGHNRRFLVVTARVPKASRSPSP